MAKEFLLVQGDKRTKANYYIPVPSESNFSYIGLIFSKRDHPFPKRVTDQIILDFGQDYPPIIEFCNLAIAEIINLREKKLINEAIRFLKKDMRKTILQRFNFIVDNQINCVPLSRNAIEIGLDLFNVFTSRYNTKQNMKNSINDVLILATALESSGYLITKDSLLNRFASDYCNGVLDENAGVLSIDFSKFSIKEINSNQESKGYINKGWQIHIRGSQGAW